MKKRVAVEQTLKNVSQYLAEKGYEIATLDPLSESQTELHNVSAVIISGQDENVMGMQDTQTKAPVIDARGMTGEEVYNHLQELEQQERGQGARQQETQGAKDTYRKINKTQL